MITQADVQAAKAVCQAIEEGKTLANEPTNPILDALNLLHRTYPGQKVQIWVGFKDKSEEFDFDARVGDSSEESPNVFAWGDTPMQAAERLIAKAGPRTKSARIAKRLAQLQDELAKLQAEAKEVA